MNLGSRFSEEGRRIKDSIYNVPKHETVRDRIIWHMKEDFQETYGFWLQPSIAEEIMDAFIAEKRKNWPGIDKQMAEGPCTKYESKGAGGFMHQVMPIARDYLKDEKGIELKKVEATSYTIA